MTNPPRPLVAGNWKMNGLRADLAEIDKLAALPEGIRPACEVMICPPATLIAAMARAVSGSAILVGGQDCHAAGSGAHTGDISAAMLADAGAVAVIVGHSERRQDHGEDNPTVRAKAEAALAQGLVAIICIGETAAQRQRGETLSILGDQLGGSVPDAAGGASTVIAYEPVWAIGSGKTPTVGEVAAAHLFIRQTLVARFGAARGQGFRLLYGGSVKAANAATLMAVKNVNGALVGGASLRAADFKGIVDAYGGRQGPEKSVR